ncbi:hypothetical protein [Arcticibacter sp. MXS-1]|uniref:hypothetical protein n=1 Tax=Arcticibacter sp. MXS-1 TaxID=3341726 RepID=UPI0035A94B5D
MKKILFKGRFIFFPIAFAAFLALISYIVMQLWNHLLPEILHVQPITFWQAAGIFILCKILFGFGGGGPRGLKNRLRHKREERLRNLSPEEREKFRQKMREFDWCEHWGKGDPRASFFRRGQSGPEESKPDAE